MKKLLLLIFSTLGILYLTSCNEKANIMTEASQETENCGNTLVSEERYKEALVYFNSKKDEIISYYGKSSKEAFGLYNAFALVYNSLGQYDTAIEYYMKVVEQYDSIYTTTLRNIA